MYFKRDICTEAVVPAAPSRKDQVLAVTFLILAIVSVVLMFVYKFIFVFLFLFCCFLACRLNQNRAREYEYIHTNDVFEVDVVFRGARRKHLKSLDLHTVLLIAPAEAAEVLAYRNVEELDFAGDLPDAAVYAMIFVQSGVKTKLLLSMTEEMKNSLKQWLPDKVR